MKKISLLMAALLVSPVIVFAQTSYNYNEVAQPQQSQLTRAQVKQELRELEAAGYNPTTANDYDYPQNIQKAERIVWQKHQQEQQQNQAQ
jgi:ABC-type Na+ efflux pump permease subunit